MLRGRCRYCGVSVSPRYIALELMAGTISTLIVLTSGFNLVTILMIVLIPFALTDILLTLQKERVPLYIHAILFVLYAMSWISLDPLFAGVLYPLLGLIYMTIKKHNIVTNMPLLIFFAFGMNVAQDFWHFFTIRL